MDLGSDVGEQILATRAVTHLRALVVLPTRDLVVQVRETFEAIAKGRGLKARILCLVYLSSLLTYPFSDSFCYGPAFILSRTIAACRKNTQVIACCL